jgi:DNA-binding transcriptional LysR family regulator
MHDLNDLYLFVQVVDHDGFAAAGRALAMPRSRLSRRIGLLEERLGVRLIQRSTRRFAVTEVGREYYRHCVAMLVEADAAQEAIERMRAQPQGIVRVSCPSSVLYFQVGEMVARFMAQCPKVEVHLTSTNRRVDVIREGFDMAIRVRFPPLEESDLVMKVLAHSTQRLVASPSVLEGVEQPLVPADLCALPSLAWGPPQRDYAWRINGPDGASAVIRHKPRFITEDMAALRLAALRGVGAVQLPTMVIRHDLMTGALVDVLPSWAPRTGIVHAVFPSRRGLLPSVRALLDFLAVEYAALDRAERTDSSVTSQVAQDMPTANAQSLATAHSNR